jgi:hypothetical protein
MKEQFEEYAFRDLSVTHSNSHKNLIKASETKIKGNIKVSVEEDSLEGVKIILKKDTNENIKEIKFVCSCGQSKSIILDYTE